MHAEGHNQAGVKRVSQRRGQAESGWQMLSRSHLVPASWEVLKLFWSSLFEYETISCRVWLSFPWWWKRHYKKTLCLEKPQYSNDSWFLDSDSLILCQVLWVLLWSCFSFSCYFWFTQPQCLIPRQVSSILHMLKEFTIPPFYLFSHFFPLWLIFPIKQSTSLFISLLMSSLCFAP